MKLKITDKFLWEVYRNVVSPTEDVVNFLLTNKYRQINLLFGKENPVFKKYRKEKGAKEFAKLLYYLKTRNYIEIKNLENKKAIILTKEGFQKVLKASFIAGDKEKRRDGKWVMLIFDVPQRYKKSRDLLMDILDNLGYKMFQQSVWVTPYDVSNKTEKLLQFHSLEKFVKIFIVEEL